MSSSAIDTRPEHSLRTRHVSAADSAFSSSLASLSACHSKGFESTLGPMMVVVSVDTFDMQRHTGSLSKALEPVSEHFRAEVANLFSGEPEINHTVGSI